MDNSLRRGEGQHSHQYTYSNSGRYFVCVTPPAGLLPAYIILRLTTEECKGYAKALAANIDSNHTEEQHSMLDRFIRAV